MLTRLAAALVAACALIGQVAILQSFAMAAGIPAENVPTSLLGTRPVWSTIPDISMECEGNVEIRISHRDASIRINGALGGRILESNAMYQTSPDRFGDYVPFVAISLLRGPGWVLAEDEGSGTWLFNNKGAFSKCLPM